MARKARRKAPSARQVEKAAGALVKTYQRRQRELDAWLSAELSALLGCPVEARAIRPAPYRPNTKAANLPGMKITMARKHAPVPREPAVADLMAPRPTDGRPLDDGLGALDPAPAAGKGRAAR